MSVHRYIFVSARLKWFHDDYSSGVNVGTGTLYIEPGGTWENGYCESFSGKLRDECLNGEVFYSLKEAQVVIGSLRSAIRKTPSVGGSAINSLTHSGTKTPSDQICSLRSRSFSKSQAMS